MIMQEAARKIFKKTIVEIFMFVKNFAVQKLDKRKVLKIQYQTLFYISSRNTPLHALSFYKNP
jgi:hypothetical protein